MKHYLSQNGPKIRHQLGVEKHNPPDLVALQSDLFPISHRLNPGSLYCGQDTNFAIENPSSKMTYQRFSSAGPQERKTHDLSVRKVGGNMISQEDQLYLMVATENFCYIENLLSQILSWRGEKSGFIERLMSYAITLDKMSVAHYLLKKRVNIPVDFNIASLQNKLIILDDYASLMRLGGRLEINNIERTTGCAPLHLAVQNNNYDMVRFLLTHQADVNHVNVFGNSPLSLAMWQVNIPIIKLLLEHKANLTIKDQTDLRDFQLEYNIPSCEMFSLRQDVGAELAHEKRVNQKILQKDLIEATNRQDINEVQSLLFLASLEDIKDIFAQAVYVAIKHGNLNLVRLFSQKCGDPKLFLAMFNHDETPVACAIRHHKQDIVSFLAQISIFPLGSSKDVVGSNAVLYRSITTEKSSMLIDVAISQGAQVNAPDQVGSMPLHHAIASNNAEIVRLLLLYQANPNASDNLGRTALHIAAEKGDKAMIQILLQSSADPTIIDRCGVTAEEIYKAKITEAACIRPNNIEELQRLFNDLSKINVNENILPDGVGYMSEVIYLD